MTSTLRSTGIWTFTVSECAGGAGSPFYLRRTPRHPAPFIYALELVAPGPQLQCNQEFVCRMLFILFAPTATPPTV
jgi:hypothetical protein